jgi:hypothetical protein
MDKDLIWADSLPIQRVQITSELLIQPESIGFIAPITFKQ